MGGNRPGHEQAVWAHAPGPVPHFSSDESAQHRRQEASMRTYVAGTVCAVLLGVAGLAQAAQLLSPPYAIKTRGNNVGTKAACVIRNAGSASVTVNVSL